MGTLHYISGVVHRKMEQQVKRNTILDARLDKLGADLSKWESIGRKYASKRQQRGLSVDFVAKSVGVSWSKLDKFEKGKPIQAAKLLQAALDLLYENMELKAVIDGRSISNDKPI